jgi:hypothetical protein
LVIIFVGDTARLTLAPTCLLVLLEVYVWVGARAANENESHYRPPNENDYHLHLSLLV